jgi:carboxymethylenebutenolidase
MTTETVTLTANDGHTFLAHRTEPAATPVGAIVVLPDRTDPNGKLRKVADELAANGYVVIAPALSFPVATGEADDADNAPQDPVMPLIGEIQSTVDSVKDCGKVALLGYGVGGGLAYVAANCVAGVACAISYYATGIVEWIGPKRKIPTLLHFGEADSVVPFPEVNQFRACHPEVSAFSYPGAAHEFDADGQAGYDEAASRLAHERTLAWISQYVVGQPPVTLKNAGAYALAKTDKKKKKSGGDDVGPPIA